jgi:RHS repeat-associated protein
MFTFGVDVKAVLDGVVVVGVFVRWGLLGAVIELVRERAAVALLGLQLAPAPFANQGQQPVVTYYTRDTGGTLLSERTPGGNYYYVEDANGSIVAITDRNGTVDNTYTYDPYGAIMTTGGIGTAPNSFGFDGGFQSQDGLYHFGDRYYNPTTGSWTQRDPLASALQADPGQTDPYAFAGDDPINDTDPNGEFSSADYKSVVECRRFADIHSRSHSVCDG